MSEQPQNTRRWIGKGFRLVGWIAMGVLLFVVAIFIAIVTLLSPSRLTPLATKLASENLEADIQCSRIEFSLLGHMPFLRLDIDSLLVLPRTLNSLSEAERAQLPAWADTMARVDHFHGAINITSLLTGTIDLSDIEVDGSHLNLVAAQHGVTNFEIIKSQPDVQSDTMSIPSIKIDRFVIRHPGPIRYYSAQDQTELAINLTTAEIIGKDQPAYRITIDSNLKSDLLAYLNRNDLAFGLNGGLIWDQDSPNQLQLRDFYVAIDSIQATLQTDIDFQNALTINDLAMEVKPVPIVYLATMLPDSMLRAYNLNTLQTDALLGLRLKFDTPYEIGGQQAVPHATVNIQIPQCYLNYDQFRFGKFETDITAVTKGDDLNAMAIDVKKLALQGERGGVAIDLAGKLTNLVEDPEFDGTVNGKVVLGSLPPKVESWLQADLSGAIEIDARLHGRSGWLTRNDFNRILVDGNAQLHQLYYAGWDTLNMLYVNQGKITFGTDKSFVTPRQHTIKDMLALSFEADSVAYLHSDIAMNVTGMRAGIGTLNNASSADTTQVNPIGGTLSFKGFNLNMLTDSAGVRIRDIKAFATMRRYKQQAKLPQFILAIDAGLIGAGAPDTRLLLRQSHIDINAHLLPLTERQKKARKTIDSIRAQFPNLSRDSIYALALERHRRNADPNFRRFREVEQDDSLLRLDMQTSKGLKYILRRFDIQGHISSEQAGFFTPYFPLRNRLRNFNLAFSTDSVIFTGLQYKAGHSDFTIAGRITNIKRSMLTDMKQPVRVHFNMASDTIDINQLADAIFRGAAYSDVADTKRVNLSDYGDDDEVLQREINSLAAEADTMAPLIVPVNFDAELTFKAKNILYSDIAFKNLDGSLLTYDGAINLHGLKAYSDMGSVTLDALYSGQRRDDLKFSFAMGVNDFNINKFYHLVPAVDTLMPILKDFAGIIDADIAATTGLLPNMDIDVPSLQAVIKLEGDSVKFLDSETFKTLAKWLFFKDKGHNMIDHIAAQMIVEDGELQLFPFMFDFDRYRLGVFGYNDLAMNYNYHIGVLKSPLPFKFGINIKGDANDFHVRLGGCKFKPGMEAQRVVLADTISVNLVREIQNVFRRGVRQSRMQRLPLGAKPNMASQINLSEDALSHADSLYLMKEGLIPQVPAPTGQ